jgi:IS30 family transposase
VRGKKEVLEERRIKALELRKTGLTFEEIGRILGVSDSQVYRDIQTYFKKTAKEPTEELRRLELERFDRYLTKLEPKIERGDTRAIEMALKISERRARLLGLDAPIETNTTVTVQLEPEVLQLLGRAEQKLQIQAERIYNYELES